MGHLKLNRRAGFTIIELLTVMAVIALMMSLLLGASFRFVASARESATATTIMKANGIIQDRVRAFQEFDFTDVAAEFTGTWNAANPTNPITLNIAEILARKARFKKAFPQAFAELDASQISRFFPSKYPPTDPNVSTTYDSKYECGILLYAVLVRGETFGATTPGDDTFVGAEVKSSPETNSLPCLVDSWGEPLRFYRWPTRLIRSGELSFSGSGSYDDYNQNSSQDVPGSVNTSGGFAFCPAIRPNPALPGPTPASLLITSLSPFNVPANPVLSGSYVLGPDNAKGSSPNNVLGWPDTDDPEPLNTDPDDPSYLLSGWFSGSTWPSHQIASYPSVSWVPTSNAWVYPNVTWVLSTGHTWTNASTFVNGALDSNNSFIIGGYHDVSTFHTPLIVSAGADRKLGLYEPTDVPTTSAPSANFGYLAAPKYTAGSGLTGSALLQDLFDDITNLNQRAGGR